MSELQASNGATQSAPPWPVEQTLMHRNPRLAPREPSNTPCSSSPTPIDHALEDLQVDIKREAEVDVEHVDATWPELKPIKFKPFPPLDLGQAFNDASHDNAALTARVAGVRIVLVSSSAQSVESVHIPPVALGPAATPQRRGRPRGSRNRRVDPDAEPDVSTLSKYGGIHDNMALRK